MKIHFLFIASTLLLTSALTIPDIPDIPDIPPPPPPPPAANTNLQPRKRGTKYFNEPGGGNILGHYDVRFFRGSPVSDEEKQDSLRHLIRSYLTVFRELNIETWLAHGTLLGWWWNGKIMPWDWDLDTQVSLSTLLWLGDNMNMTYHNYTLEGTNEQRRYLLDVNPNIVLRTRGNGLNIIDARWVDLRNGLFIDITGVSETDPRSLPGVWSCKNYHRYRTRELYPLRETVFEGAPALVPFSFDGILTTEYTTNALTSTYHEGHRWVPEQKAWIKVIHKATAMNPTRPSSASNGGGAAGAGAGGIAVAKPHIPSSLQEEKKGM